MNYSPGMSTCSTCGNAIFVKCWTHGFWCPLCDKSMVCPTCNPQRGSILVDLLTAATILATVPAAFWALAWLNH